MYYSSDMVPVSRRLQPRRMFLRIGSFSKRFQVLLIVVILVSLILARGFVSIPAADAAPPRTQQVPAGTPRLVDTLGRPIASPRVGDLVIEATIRNNDTVEHRVTFIVQIKDNSGVVVPPLGWVVGITLAPDSSATPGLQITISTPGTYMAEVFVITTIAEGIPLSLVRSMNFTVSA
jgi:hypothetical protein